MGAREVHGMETEDSAGQEMTPGQQMKGEQTLPAGDRALGPGSKHPLHYSNNSFAASAATLQSAALTKIYCPVRRRSHVYRRTVSVSKSLLPLNGNV